MEPVYVIVENSFVIAQDLRETLNDLQPDCRITAVAGLRRGIAEIAGQTRITAAFVSAEPEDIRQSGFAAAVRAVGGRLIVISDGGGAGPEVPDGWTMIPGAFNTTVIRDALRRSGLLG